MPYRLKPNVENFEVVDGPFAQRKFISGEIYAEIPPNEAGKFDEIKPADGPAKTTKRADNQKTEVTDA